MDLTTLNVLVGAIAGFLGSLIMAPVTTLLSSKLKKDEIELQNKLDVIAKQRELFLEHRLEIKRQEYEQKIKVSNENEKVSGLEKKLIEAEAELQAIIKKSKNLEENMERINPTVSQLRLDLGDLGRKFKELDEKVQPALYVNARVDLLEKKVYTNG